MAKLYWVVFIQVAAAWEPPKPPTTTSRLALPPMSSGLSVLPVHRGWKRTRNNCILCFFTSFLTVSKRKKDLFLLKIARLWGNEISPSPGALGVSPGERKSRCSIEPRQHLIKQSPISIWGDHLGRPSPTGWIGSGTPWLEREESREVKKDWTSSHNKSRRIETVLARLRLGHTNITHVYLMQGQTEPPEFDRCRVTITVKTSTRV